MIAFLDVGYRSSGARAACVLANSWQDDIAVGSYIADIASVAEYEPGQFFRRELPCLMEVLRRLPLQPVAVVIDGYVWLPSRGRAGLGAHLYEALGRRIPVIGIAKTAFAGAEVSKDVVKVLRGNSKRPLFVTAVGVDLEQAAGWVKSMSGAHRMPALMAAADRLSRTGSCSA